MLENKERQEKMQEMMKEQRFQAEFNKKGEPTKTFCNLFIMECCHMWDCNDLDGMLANDMVKHMTSSPLWMEIDAEPAQNIANQGGLVVVGAKNPSGHGHVAIVIPGEVADSMNLKKKVPFVASVGKHNYYGKHAGFAFTRDMMPKYWAWRNS